MADFPTLGYMPSGAVISMTASLCSGIGAHAGGASSTAGGVWPAANRALYQSFTVESTVTAIQMIIIVVTQSGNLDMGIYDANANRLVSSGSTGVAVAGVQIVNIADTVLTPGTYFSGMCVDNATASFNRATTFDINSLRACGMAEQAVGVVTLPNPATFAIPSSAYYPLIGIATVATV